MADFRLELVTPRQRRALALGGAALLLLAASTLAWLWPQLPRPYTAPPPGPVIVLAAQFDSPRSGWVALRSGIGPQAPSGIYRTDDGGRSWQPLPVPVRTPTAASLRFFDPRSGVLEMTRDESDGRTSLFATADGGGSWQSLSLPAYRNGRVSLFFADARAGFEVFQPSGSAAALVYRTADGGRTWSRPPMAGLPDGRPLFGVGFIDAVHGFAWAEVLDGLRLFRTTDAADSWTPTATPFVFQEPLAAEPPMAFGSVVIYPVSDVLLVSRDGGASFDEFREPPVAAGTDAHLACADALHCALAYTRFYVSTSDGGRTWTTQAARLPKGVSFGPLQQVDAHTASSIATTAQGQHLLVTHDSGATWHEVALPRI